MKVSEGKQSVFVLSFKQLNKVNTNVMLKQMVFRISIPFCVYPIPLISPLPLKSWESLNLFNGNMTGFSQSLSHSFHKWLARFLEVMNALGFLGM